MSVVKFRFGKVSLMKFGSSLFKGSQVEGRALVASAEAKSLLRPFFGSFFGLLLQRKNGKNFLNVTRPNFLPAFFFDTSGAKQKAWQRRNAENVFAPAGATRAPLVDFWMLNFAEIQHRVASLTLESIKTFTRHHPFLKKATQKLSSCGGEPFWGRWRKAFARKRVTPYKRGCCTASGRPRIYRSAA